MPGALYLVSSVAARRGIFYCKPSICSDIYRSLMDNMRYDYEARLLERVKIYSAVLNDWHRDGLDAQHADDLA